MPINTIKQDVIDGAFGFRNKIINGKMDVSQRGTSFAASHGAYTLDRWVLGSLNTTAVSTVSQSADVPSSEFQNSLRLTVTTADATVNANRSVAIAQRIEGYNARDLIGRPVALSFWVRSSKVGIHCVALRNAEPVDRSYVAEYTVVAANVWEKKTVIVPSGLIITGNWNWTTGVGLQLSFIVSAGSAIQSTANVWQTGNFLATANQVNCLDTVGNIFAITGVQLEAGSVATPFEHRPVGVELALCQRYWQLVRISTFGHGAAAGASIACSVPFFQQVRSTPTLATRASIESVGVNNVGFSHVTTNGAKYAVTASAAMIFGATIDVSIDAEL